MRRSQRGPAVTSSVAAGITCEKPLQLRDQQLREGPAVGASLALAAEMWTPPLAPGVMNYNSVISDFAKGKQWEQASRLLLDM